ncbi:major facilitator superfamily domain-containing protein 8-like isoform X2 [Pelodiscus sinensis]
MEYQRKKKLTNCTIGLLFLSGGIEYAVILPTIWAYLQTLHAEPYFLGLGISAFSLTGLLVGPLFGHWSDRSQRTKAVILFANMFEIAGNFMYFMGISKWLLLGSRLVAGVGTGVGASIFGYLTRSTTSQERATVFAAVMACRQVGLLIGPACNLFLRLCNFRLGPFEVNKFTAPGLFMCLLWVLLQFVVMAMYYDLQPGPHLQRAALAAPEEEEKPLVQHEAGQEERDGQHGYGSTGTAQRAPGEPPEGDEYRYVPNGHLAEEEGREKETSPFQNFSVMREYLREEVVVLLTAQFITLFNQTALETMVTPITQRYLSFGELENSIMYFLCGIEVICGFFLVRCLSSRLPDRVILVLGLVICNVACVWCLLFLARPRGSFPVLLTELVVGVFLQVLGLPFVAVSQVSLFSKVTAEKTQGFSQGLRRSVGGVATILGPLWAGGLTENLYVMLGVMMGLLSLLTVMVGLSYSYLVEPPRGYVPGPSQEEQRS